MSLTETLASEVTSPRCRHGFDATTRTWIPKTVLLRKPFFASQAPKPNEIRLITILLSRTPSCALEIGLSLTANSIPLLTQPVRWTLPSTNQAGVSGNYGRAQSSPIACRNMLRRIHSSAQRKTPPYRRGFSKLKWTIQAVSRSPRR